MPNLGKKYACYSCHTKFYDLDKPVPLCPKCGADQRDAEEAPLVPTSRSRKIVEEPAEDEVETTEETPDDEEGELIGPAEKEEVDEEEEEEY